MAEARGIFKKELRLTPRQVRSVADRRFDDAMCLFEIGQNARLNGAMYLGGFVIECLLKALLLERRPNVQGRLDPATLSKPDQEVYVLLFAHDLDEMLLFLPEVEAKMLTIEDERGKPLWPKFKVVCEQWTIYARYSPKQAKREEAGKFLDTIAEARKWLKEF